MGLADGLAASSSANSSEDILQFMSLKKQRDPRVRGITFEAF